jgi:hypothetical protein
MRSYTWNALTRHLRKSDTRAKRRREVRQVHGRSHGEPGKRRKLGTVSGTFPARSLYADLISGGKAFVCANRAITVAFPL